MTLGLVRSVRKGVGITIGIGILITVVVSVARQSVVQLQGVIVRFVRRIVAEDFMNSKRGRKNLSSRDLSGTKNLSARDLCFPVDVSIYKNWLLTSRRSVVLGV